MNSFLFKIGGYLGHTQPSFPLYENHLCLLKRLIMYEKCMFKNGIPNTVPLTERKTNLSDFRSFFLFGVKQ